MKPLLCIAVTLSFAWLACGAPQPLSLRNITTISDISDLTSRTTTNSPSSDVSLSPTSQPTDRVLLNSTDSGESDKGLTESNPESSMGREDLDLRTLTNIDTKERTPYTSTGDDVTVEFKSTLPSEIYEKSDPPTLNAESTPGNYEAIDDTSEETASRYVPPLDPMKHMLMMSDMKSNPIAEVKENVEITTTDTPRIEETELKTEIISTENSEEIEKVVAESSEVEENLEPIATDTAVSDPTSSTVLFKSDELSSEKDTDLDTETSVDSNSTFILSTSTTTISTTTSPTIQPTVEDETLSHHKNAELEIESEGSTTERGEDTTENASETTPTVFVSTEKAIKVDVTTSNPLLKNIDEIKTEESILDTETSSFKTFVEESDFEVKSSDINKDQFSTTSTTVIPETTFESSSSSVINKELLSTTSTTVIPETTFESSSSSAINKDLEFTTSSTVIPETTFESHSEQPSTIENEKKDISLDDELEFRSVKLPLNASKVEYAPEVPNDPIEVESIPESDSEIELTTANILTTISEILFSSSSVDASDLLRTEDKEGKSTSSTEADVETTETNRKDTDLTLPLEKLDLDAESDNGAILPNDPADMLKVHSVTEGLDSVPADDVSTNSPSTETTVTEKHTIESSTEEPEIETEEILIENAQNEKLAESTLKPESTSTFTPTVEDITTATSEPNTEIPSTSPESESGIDFKNSDTSESELENQSNATVTAKPAEFFSNIKDRYISGDNRDMVAAVQFLHYHDKASSEQCFKLVDAHWNYATNLTEENKKKQLEQTLEYSLFHKAAWKNATSFSWKSFNDTLLRRWFKSLSVLGTAALPEDKLNEFNKLKAEMKNTYSTAKICAYVPPEKVRKGQILTEKDCNLTLEPDLQRILTKSRDYDELVHVWKSWREASGKPIREKYLRFVDLSNEAARMNGFSDTGDMWREAYESESFETDLEELWGQLKPLYEHLHAYVRRRLIKQYGEDKVKEDGPIPAHLFGNMWAQSWVSLLDITQPFPGKPSVDVTPIMEAKNMTARQMFKISEEFFTSLGLKPMPEPFWRYSLIEKPKDREIICHASAWDFCNGRDYRIKQCTDITMEDLITVHHEMGHIQYFLQYARQPNVFREGANPGFHEAIGDVLALSVSTPKHLQSIGLLDEVADDPEGDLNFLLYTALDKVSFLPSGYLIDLWRWGLFSGDIKPEEMNSKWWDLRLKYQGVCPPVKRTDTDFDPGAKFHVPGNVPYIRYFVSFVIQFQFHKVLCDAAGHTGPLYKCDIYRSKEAGQILSQVMELGSSEHWSEAMKIMTGGATNKMDAGPILEYFDPLLQFLKEQNRNETIGWRSDDPTVCP